MTPNALTPEREKEIHLQLEQVADALDTYVAPEDRRTLQQAYRDLKDEIDRLRAAQSLPPGMTANKLEIIADYLFIPRSLVYELREWAAWLRDEERKKSTQPAAVSSLEAQKEER